MHRCRRPKYARVRLAAGPERNAGVEHRVDIQIMALMLTVQADFPSDSDAAHQSSDAAAQDVGAVERLLDRSRVARPWRDFAHHGPFRPLDAMHPIPFGIFGDDDAALIGRDRPTA